MLLSKTRKKVNHTDNKEQLICLKHAITCRSFIVKFPTKSQVTNQIKGRIDTTLLNLKFD